MKKLLTLAICAFTAANLFAYDIASSLEIKGNVKTVTKTNFSIVSKFGEYYRSPSSKIVYKYDDSKKVIESSELTNRDALVNRITNEYDAQGNLIAERCFDSTNVQLWNTVITYKNGKKTDSSEYSQDGTLRGRTIYTYTNNLLTDESYYDGEGAIVWKIVSKYNAKNQLESEYEYYEDGTLAEKREYSYNNSGKLDSILYYQSETELSSKDIFRYDDKQILTEITSYNSDNKVTFRTLAKYDSQGNVSRVTVYNVVRKFGTTINEMADMMEYSYEF